MDPNLLKLTVYQKILPQILALNGNITETMAPQLYSWIKARDIFDAMNKNPNKTILETYHDKISEVSDIRYRALLNRTLQELLEFGNGDPAYDFSAFDVTGNKKNLGIFAGKVILIDLWATWCGPCIALLPTFEQLKNDYKSNHDVVFISLSIDDNKTKWKSKVSELGLTGNQWITDRVYLEKYRVSGVPRTIIVGKDFTIAELRGPALSDRKLTRQAIDNLLNEGVKE
jgi:thiol-disulfide isomerase/thioredoxin